jgi:signal transduction histidine kinase
VLETPADPAVFLNRLSVSRRALVHGVLLARLAALAMVLTLPEQRRMVSQHPAAVALVWSALAAYLIGAVIAWERVATLLERRPAILWIDVAVCAALVIVGAGGRLAFYYLAAAPVVVAAVLGSLVMAVTLAAAQALVVAPVFLFGLEPGMEQAHSTEWAPGLVGLFVAVGLFAIVRSLFDQLQETAVAYRDSAEATAAAVRAAAAAEQRGRVMRGLNTQLDELLGRLCSDASRLRGVRVEDPEWAAQALEVERIARDAAQRLQLAVADEPPPATVAAAIALARERVQELGAARIELVVDGCGRLGLDPAAAIALTRFVQEAVTNAWKHGEPPVIVRACAQGSRVVLTVTDRGAGFTPEAAGRRRGLRSLAHDARTLGGRVGIARAAGGGTAIQLEFEAGDA